MAFLSLCMLVAQAQEYSLIYQDHQAKSIQVSNSETIQIRLAGKQTNIAGKLLPADNGVIFTPIFPFTNNVSYDVVFADKVLFTFTPTSKAEGPKYVTIYPQASRLPENFLKFYFEFDQKMAVGKFYDNLHLFKNGKEVDAAFVLLNPELWDPEGRILTVWLDPGRVKRDLGPNRHAGQVLNEGSEYQLVLDAEFQSATGQALSKKAIKEFVVIGRDVIKPNISHWKITTPITGGSKAMLLATNEPMDHSIIYMLKIMDSTENQVPGQITFVDDQNFRFIPKSSWKPGSYTLQINARIEDLASNNLNRLFDEDLEKKDNLPTDIPYYFIEFQVGGKVN